MAGKSMHRLFVLGDIIHSLLLLLLSRCFCIYLQRPVRRQDSKRLDQVSKVDFGDDGVSLRRVGHGNDDEGERALRRGKQNKLDIHRHDATAMMLMGTGATANASIDCVPALTSVPLAAPWLSSASIDSTCASGDSPSEGKLESR